MIAPRRRITIGVVLAAALSIARATPENAVWPEKPLRVIVPVPPGDADAVPRLISSRLAASLGQAVIVENRPGAANNTAMEAVARSAPDGHTLLLALTGVALNPHLYELRFDPMRDLVAVAQLTRMRWVLLARPSLPAVTVGEVLALARSTPHGLSCATASGLPQLGCQMLRSLGRVPLTEVTFKGLGPAMSELMGERLDVMFQTYSAAASQVRAQRVKALASADAERRAGELGDLPMIAESLPGFHLASWTGIMAPAGTPEAIVRRLNREIADALRDPALREQIGRIGIDVATGPPEAFAELIRRDHERYGRLVREFGVRVR